MLADQIVFIVDLNELENGDELPVSMDFTVTGGPQVLNTYLPQPQVSEWVLVHSDDDNTLYYAKVLSVESERDMTVRIRWESRAPVLNEEWSAQDIQQWVVTRESPTLVAELR
jgi:hypothetical protein